MLISTISKIRLVPSKEDLQKTNAYLKSVSSGKVSSLARRSPSPMVHERRSPSWSQRGPVARDTPAKANQYRILINCVNNQYLINDWLFIQLILCEGNSWKLTEFCDNCRQRNSRSGAKVNWGSRFDWNNDGTLLQCRARHRVSLCNATSPWRSLPSRTNLPHLGVCESGNSPSTTTSQMSMQRQFFLPQFLCFFP